MNQGEVVWSIVIPLYNKAPYIEATIRSVLAQGGSDYEVIVVDDGSTDGGAERVIALADKRVRVIRQENSGVSEARNLGIGEARGQWVVLLDADDLMHPQTLEAYRLLWKTIPDSMAIGGAYIRVDEGRVENFQFEPHRSDMVGRVVSNLPEEIIKRGMPFSSSSIALRVAALRRLSPLFPPRESMGEDLDLWLRFCEVNPILITDQVLAMYRTALPDSLMGSYRREELLPVWHRLRDRAQSGALDARLARSSLRLVAEMEITVARKRLKAGAVRGAWKLLASAAMEGIASRRWWLTLFVSMTGSSSLARWLR